MTRFINLLIIIIIINHAYWRCELTQASVGHFNTTPKLAAPRASCELDPDVTPDVKLTDDAITITAEVCH